MWENYWQKTKIDNIWQKPDKHIVELASKLKEENKLKVLDFGCGCCRHAIYLAQMGFKVYACDPSRDAIRYCKKEFEKYGLSGYLAYSDYNKIPFKNILFDWIIVFNVIYHNLFNDMIKTINKFYNVLNSKGYLFLTLLSKNNSKYGKGIELEPDTFIYDKTPLSHEKEIPHHFSHEKEIRILLKNFRILSITEEKDSYSSFEKNFKSIHWYILCQK